MAVTRVVLPKKVTLDAEGKAQAAVHKGKNKATVTLNDLKDMVLPLLEREGYYDPTP
jgi:hypothetical protein